MTKKNAKINNIFNILKSSKKRLVFAFLFLFIIVGLFLLISPKENFIKTTARKLFSGNTPVSQVEITTDDYDNEGSIKLTKEAHWVSKTEAELDLKLETIRKTGDNKKDIILVFDVSGSMEGEKLEKVKEDASELINYVLDKDEDNKVGLITFASESRIISPLTDDKNSLLDTIEGMSVEDSTNYYLAYKSIEEILSDYNKETGKDLVVLFMTDGSPTENAGATKGVYESLKEQHPYMTLNAVEYEKGKSTSDTQDISDGQWIADMNTLNNILFEATVSPEPYEKIKVIDYIDNEYFDIETNTPSKGNVVIDNNKITWRFSNNSYITGSEETLKVRLKLKEQYQNIKGLYPTNKRTEIEYKIDNEKEKASTLTPILKNNYDVIYDINTPENCTLEDPEGENHFIYDTVTIKNIEPKCTGYQLKGWQIEERDVKYKSEDKFIMPEEDVHIRAIWSRQTMKAYMDGTVHEKTTLYKELTSNQETIKYLKEYTGSHSDSYDKSGDNKIYYFYANNQISAENILQLNNVIFGGFCWQIIRTTDTGGIKMIYNGVPDSQGKCKYSNQKNIIASSKYNQAYNSPAYIGYMYNKVYPYKSIKLDFSSQLFLRGNFNKSHYYSRDFNYNGNYKLESNNDGIFTGEQCAGEKTCENKIKGVYTLFSSNIDQNSPNISYVYGVKGEYIYYLTFNGGKGKETANKEYYVGNSYKINQDGTYTVTNENSPIDYYTLDTWIENYANIKNKYMCIGTNPCEKLMYVSSTGIRDYSYSIIQNNYIYANDFDYVLNENTGEYEYVLKDTDTSNKMQFWQWNNKYKQINKNHYTCFNDIGHCSKIKYIYYTDSTTAYYIELEKGESIEDALHNMLYSDEVNIVDSTVKSVVDTWYEENLISFSQFLEDTVFCNDRTINNKYGWAPTGNTDSYLVFKKGTIECQRETDRFSTLNDRAKLKYPIGLFSWSEMELLGNANVRKSSDWFWLASPRYLYFNGGYAGIRVVSSAGDISESGINSTSTIGVRPAISLKPEIEYIDGDGTTSNPYIIDTTE